MEHITTIACDYKLKIRPMKLTLIALAFSGLESPVREPVAPPFFTDHFQVVTEAVNFYDNFSANEDSVRNVSLNDICGTRTT
ncbi:hypothetical protein BH11VER1_BH11VER1_20360 [soil metagenome]